MKHSLEDFPFRIRDVEQLMGLRPRRTRTGNSDFDCIFCGGKGKMNINYQKNVYGCVRCGCGGGMVDLYARYYHLTAKEAYEEICSGLHLDGEVPVYREPVSLPEPIPEEQPKANAEVIHKTYCMLLSSLTLSQKHLEDLKGRGLTERQIEEQRYRSTPLFGFRKLAEKLLAEGCTLQGVPGFYQDKTGNWTINFSGKNSGFLIPVRSIDGKIQGMQIRVDKVVDKRKYIWFSSANRKMGTSSGSPIHMIGDPDSEEVYVTEGPLKGTVAHYLSGKTFVAVAGVNQYKGLSELLDCLKQRNLKKVFEAHDMEKLQNLKVTTAKCLDCEKPCDVYRSYLELRDTFGEAELICMKLQTKRQNVQRGCMHLYNLCKEKDLLCQRMVWNLDSNGEWDGKCKGIDDFYFEHTGGNQNPACKGGCI